MRCGLVLGPCLNLVSTPTVFTSTRWIHFKLIICAIMWGIAIFLLARVRCCMKIWNLHEVRKKVLVERQAKGLNLWAWEQNVVHRISDQDLWVPLRFQPSTLPSNTYKMLPRYKRGSQEFPIHSGFFPPLHAQLRSITVQVGPWSNLEPVPHIPTWHSSVSVVR